MSFSALGRFPAYRPRRLRQSAAMRAPACAGNLAFSGSPCPPTVLPARGKNIRQAVPSMPGVFQLSSRIKSSVRRKSPTKSGRAGGVALWRFPNAKDEAASGAYARNGIVQQTSRQLKKEFPELLVITDVCLCEYMSHGHCGIVEKNKGGRVANDRTLKLLARTAVSHAEAGADIVAPSDMMDGRVAALREALDDCGP